MGGDVWYSSKFNKTKKQFDVLINDKAKHGTKIFHVIVKYDNDSRKLIIDCLHLKSNLHRVCVYVKA